MSLSSHVHHFALVISIYDLDIFIDVWKFKGVVVMDRECCRGWLRVEPV